MLKHRLIFGTLMTVLFIGIIIFGGWLDGSLTTTAADDKPIQGTVLCVLIAILVIAGQLELSKLFSAKNLKNLTPVSSVSAILLASSWWWQQFAGEQAGIYLSLIMVFSLMALLLYQYLRYGVSGVVGNCGVSCFSILYLGALSSFVLGIRIEFGLWALLMFVSVVKSSDIGAYTFGRMFGRHKFSPNISPGKTWEGMAGAVAAAILVSVLFAVNCGIMAWQLAVVFGFCMAFTGQAGDLAESMIKRDAEQKDSSNNVPGFGGLLDIMDSPLIAAAFGYLFFMLSCL